MLVERYYSTGIYPIIGSLLRALSGIVPFSTGDFLYTAIIAWALWRIFVFARKVWRRTLVKKQIFEAPLYVLTTFLLFFLCFKILWGFNYDRPRINRQLGIADSTYTVQELKQLAGFLILRISTVKPDRSVTYTMTSLEKATASTYQELEKVHPMFRYSNPNIKAPVSSWYITRIGLEGYYNPFTGEAHVNSKLLPLTLPFTSCHEAAHQLGIAREDEANLVAYLTGINSKDPNFRYAAYYNVLRSVLFELSFKSPGSIKAIMDILPDQVTRDLQSERDFWREHNNAMFGYMNVALDSYLKFNRQPQGIKSYQNIVVWVFNLHSEEIKNFSK